MTFRKLDLFPSSGERGEKTPTHLGSLERANSTTGQPLSDLHSYLIIRDQANSAGNNKKIHSKNCDKSRTCVELGWKSR
jgi:hypothetical protein